MILLPPGATQIDLAWGPMETAARVQRPLTSRIEATATSCPSDLFDLSVKIVLIKDLVPLLIAATLDTDGIGVISTLFFGPVRLDWGRTWGDGAHRWGSIQLSARPRLSLFVGVDAAEKGFDPFAGVRIFPSGHGLWEIDVSVRPDGIRVSAGGVPW